MYRDARARGSDSPSTWGGLCGWIPILLIVYLLYRPRIGGRTEPAGRRERLAGSIGLGFLLSFLAGAVLSPPDPFSQLLWFAGSAPLGVLVGYLLVWRRGYSKLRGVSTN